MQMLVDHPARAECDLRSVRMVGYGAAPISEALLDRAIPAFPNASFEQGYGQSELSPCLTILGGHWHTPAGRAQANKLRSAGQPLVGCEIRIVDEAGVELPTGQVGEVVARSPGVMLGYWNAPEASAHALRDGWLHTGDVGFLDADGFLTLVDRLKDLIVSGGENVFSAEVENALAKHPAVAACAVIGIPDERWGEAVHAVVVPRDPATAPEAQVLIEHCRTLIAGYKCPRSVAFVPALPLSPVGKILKYQLREPYWRGHGRNVA
jgi:acyl-CoA synthetase (AMP-forming)/AMP-acid ligase II